MNYYLLGYKQGCGSAFLFFGSWICFFLNADPDPAAFLMRIRILFFPPRSRYRRENGCRSGSTALVTKRLNLIEKNNHSQRQHINKNLLASWCKTLPLLWAENCWGTVGSGWKLAFFLSASLPAAVSRVRCSATHCTTNQSTPTVAICYCFPPDETVLWFTMRQNAPYLARKIILLIILYLGHPTGRVVLQHVVLVG